MRNLIYFVVLLVVATACNSHNGESKTEGEATTVQDSAVITDSLKSEATDSVMKNDSINGIAEAQTVGEKKESSEEAKKPSPNAKKIEKDLKWFEHDVKQYKEAIRCGMIGYELAELGSPCFKNEKNLKKYEDEMTPEQKKRFKKYQKMLYSR